MNRLWHKRPVVFGALLLAFAMIAAACGDSTDDTTAAPGTTEATTAAPDTTAGATTTAAPTTTEGPSKPYGGEAIAASDQEPPTLNSFAPGGDNSIVSIIGQGYFAGVWDVDGFTLELIPDLVTELPTVSNGGVVVNADGTMTVRYTIRDEAVWSDGTQITGDDFQYTLDIILDPDLPTFKATYEDIVDSNHTDKTFEYTLSAPTTQFETIFGVIIPKHAVEGSDFIGDWNDTLWPSAGPFVFDQWQKGEFIRLVRNDNYWRSDPETGQQLPYLDSVIFRFIPETESIINAFRAREIDMIQPPPSTDTIETLQALEAEGASVEVLSGPVWEHLNFQFGDNRLVRNPDSVNDNLNYRKAVAHAVNRKVIVDDILGGQVEPLESFVEVFAPTLSQGSWAQYDYNVETAKTFVEAAKTELGLDEIKTVFSTTSNNDARVKLSELFVNMFTDAGITYENQLEDSQIFFGETLDFGLWDLGEWAWSSAPGFSSLVGLFDLFDPELAPPDGQNFYRWGTAEVSGQEVEGFNQGPSALIDEHSIRFAEIRDELNATVDVDVLIPLIAEAESILADQVVFIPLYARLVTAAVWADEIGGWKHNPTSASYTWNMEEWYRSDL